MTNKKIWFKYGSNKDNKILDKFSTKSVDYFLFVPGKNVENNWMSISDLIFKENFIIDPSLYTFLATEKYIENMSKNSFKLIKEIFQLTKDEFIEKGINNEEKIEYLKKNKNDFVKNLIEYQKGKFLINDSNESKSVDIFSFNKIQGKENENENFINILSPYFYLEPENFYKKLMLNLEYLKEFENQVQDIKLKNKKIYILICLNLKILKDEKNLNKIIYEYSLYKKYSFIFWFDDFDPWDKKIDEETFKNIKNFFENIGKNNLILHGGFAFNFFRNSGIDSIITNVGYGEKRLVFGTGGRPVPYYYLNKIHRRINLTNFFPFLMSEKIYENNFINTEKFKNIICECDSCISLIKIINSLNSFENKIDFFQKILLSSIKDLKDKNELKIRQIIQDHIWNHFVNCKINELKNSNYNKESLVKWENNINEVYKSKESKMIDENQYKNIINFIALLKKYYYEK